MIALGLTCAAPMAFAESEEQEHAAHHPAQSAEPEAATTSSDDRGGGGAGLVQENMKKIEGLMEQIQAATDPGQKRELLSQHLQALREQMRLIRSQRSDMKMSMKGGCKKDDGMMCEKMKDGRMMGSGMMMHKKMDRRVDMLERMLQQMIEREASAEHP
ncbi:MAG TPA: hypothetical protein VFA81_13300 [Burkholderiales bacterium]|nr:hypothetical protein [Burkholderiales bacterium]